MRGSTTRSPPMNTTCPYPHNSLAKLSDPALDLANTTPDALESDASPPSASSPELGDPPVKGALLPDGPTMAPVVKKHGRCVLVQPGQFAPEKHYYPRVLNAQIHPLVSAFLHLGNERIISRYCHLNPQLNTDHLREILSYRPQYFFWAGSDLFNVTTLNGNRQMICIETNSCPSGNKSMPQLSDQAEFGGYQVVLERSFKDLLDRADPSLGGLAVVFDKNPMEASGYAAVMAELCGEPVYLVEFFDSDKDPPVRWIDKVMQNGYPSGLHFDTSHSDRGKEYPFIHARLFSIIVSCLAGGRNKSMAAKAYELYNHEIMHMGICVRTPDTQWDICKKDARLAVNLMGGHAVIKVPYANAGQGVYTITRPHELDRFLSEKHRYDKFIVQSLIGNASWSSQTTAGKFFHVGTVPDKKLCTFVADLRMMVCASSQSGFQPVAIYARRAKAPLISQLGTDPYVSTWDMLGTNLSIKDEHGGWTTDTNRLLLMDRKDFNNLGLGMDDLIDAYIQTCLSVIAIDKMCQRLMPDGVWDQHEFSMLNPDEALLREILL